MSLDFESIYFVAQKLKLEKFGKNLQDAEIMALYCCWMRLTYSGFIKEQASHLSEYSHLYLRPDNLKSEYTLPACTHRVVQWFREKFKFETLTKNTFRSKILELYNQKDNPSRKEFVSFLEEYDQNFRTTNGPCMNLEQKQDQDQEVEESKSKTVDEKFIGRENDLNALVDLLEKHKVVFLHGFHGVGKTYFLQKLGSLLQDKYRFFYSDFESINSFEEWVVSILTWSGIEYQLEPLSLVKNFLDFLEKEENLLVLDSVGQFDGKFASFIESFIYNSKASSRIVISSSHIVKVDIPEEFITRYRLNELQNEKDIHDYMSSLGLKDKDCWNKLSEKYCGNFREIKYVSKFINDFFRGSVAEYLKVNTDLISSDLYSYFKSIKFIDIDFDIFSVFSRKNSGISSNVFDLLKRDRSSGEIFARIQFLCDQGYLIRAMPDEEFLSYSVLPLLEQYLIQEKSNDA